MAKELKSKGFYVFADFRLDLGERQLFREGSPVPLPPKVFETLLALVEDAGHILEKEELMARLWPDTFVEENNLNKNVSLLRKTLGSGEAAFIETIPRRGYRFTAPVTFVPGPDSNPPERTEAPVEDTTVAPIPLKKRSFPVAWSVAASALAVAMIFGVMAFRRPRAFPAVAAAPSQQVTRTVQMTTWNGLDVYPSLSPDGNTVAYTSDHDGTFDVYVRQTAPGGREVRLTTGEDAFQPDWSPDGKFIAFYSRSKRGIWIVPAFGGVARQATTFGSRPKWSPDGTLIAFQTDGLTDFGPGAFGAMPPSTLWLVPTGGGAPKQITRPGQPVGGHGIHAWFPDGKRLVFIAHDFGRATLWTMTIDGEAPHRLLADGPALLDPVVAPDGRAIYFVGASVSKNFTIMKVPVAPETGETVGPPEEITVTGAVAARNLTISRDGRRLVYAGLWFSSEIYSVPVSESTGEATGEPRALTGDRSFRKTFPAFSPDGSKVAYSAIVTGQNGDVWVVDADGKNPRPVTTAPEPDGLPMWLPGGDGIAHMSLRNGRAGLFATRLSDGSESLLAMDSRMIDASVLRMSPDGRHLLFNVPKDGATNLWLGELGGGPPRQLTNDPELAGFGCWSPDGKYIAFEMKRGEDAHVAIIPSEGGTPVQLTNERGQSWTGSFSPDGSKIVFAGLRGTVWNLRWVSRDGTRTGQITRHVKANAFVRYPVWSPRGNQIVYEYAETTGNLWMLELK